MSSEQGYFVFISHSGTDAWAAKQIQKELERLGAETFLSELDLECGDEIGDRMKVAMKRAHECLVLYTPEAAKSMNVWLEIGGAWVDGKRIVMLLNRISVDEITGDSRFPPYLKSLDFNDLNAHFYSKYLPQVAARVGEQLDVAES